MSYNGLSEQHESLTKIMKFTMSHYIYQKFQINFSQKLDLGQAKQLTYNEHTQYMNGNLVFG